MLALTALFVGAARAEDFCDTLEINSKIDHENNPLLTNSIDLSKVKQEEDEQEVRQKCKVGDVIIPFDLFMAARLCDLNKPMAGHELCFLAPPRKTY